MKKIVYQLLVVTLGCMSFLFIIGFLAVCGLLLIRVFGDITSKTQVYSMVLVASVRGFLVLGWVDRKSRIVRLARLICNRPFGGFNGRP